MSYLTHRHQYVQIDDQSSSRLSINFGVPQGSILGPVLFNLYVAELPSCTNSDTIQYADDTTAYRSCKSSNIISEIRKLETDVEEISNWSAENGLVFNNDKLKFIVFSSKRKENDKSYLIRSDRKSIAQETTVKLLGVTFDQNLSWTSHIINITKASYGILRVLKTFKRFTPFKVRKSLAESLVLSRLNYCNVVFGQLPKYLQNRLQRVENCAAGYVLGRYAKLIDVVHLNWLPIVESIDYNIVKCAFKSLHDKNWPLYLHCETVKHRRVLRSNGQGPKIDYAEKCTFQNQCEIFNDLPITIRQCEDQDIFTTKVRRFFKDKALTRALSL